ncbi:MAG TPA: tripartite tricarboxylate transporter substrate-binding protein, partial [Casimicrobiaceae bacterium]|nr:tripartite tricarboxylate transporter substrate-binding protein [Casimicrobiaceae bacterium]
AASAILAREFIRGRQMQEHLAEAREILTQDIVQRLNEEIRAILAMPDVRARFAELGFDVVGDKPDEFGEFLRAENQKWSKIAKISGTKLD